MFLDRYKSWNETTAISQSEGPTRDRNMKANLCLPFPSSTFSGTRHSSNQLQ
jgi:hypothetical protein